MPSAAGPDLSLCSSKEGTYRSQTTDCVTRLKQEVKERQEVKGKGMNGLKGPQFKSISKECGGGFLVFSRRDEVEVNKFGSWECSSLQVVTRQ